jgi:hypothetical protein
LEWLREDLKTQRRVLLKAGAAEITVVKQVQTVSDQVDPLIETYATDILSLSGVKIQLEF